MTHSENDSENRDILEEKISYLASNVRAYNEKIFKNYCNLIEGSDQKYLKQDAILSLQITLATVRCFLGDLENLKDILDSEVKKIDLYGK